MLRFVTGFLGVAFIHAGWTMKTTSLVDLVIMGVGLDMVVKAVVGFMGDLGRFLESIDRSG